MEGFYLVISVVDCRLCGGPAMPPWCAAVFTLMPAFLSLSFFFSFFFLFFLFSFSIFLLFSFVLLIYVLLLLFFTPLCRFARLFVYLCFSFFLSEFIFQSSIFCWIPLSCDHGCIPGGSVKVRQSINQFNQSIKQAG